jgi:hypothetical protein
LHFARFGSVVAPGSGLRQEKIKKIKKKMSAAPAQPAADPRFVTWVTSGSRFEVDPNYRFVKLLGQGAYGVVV